MCRGRRDERVWGGIAGCGRTSPVKVSTRPHPPSSSLPTQQKEPIFYLLRRLLSSLLPITYHKNDLSKTGMIMSWYCTQYDSVNAWLTSKGKNIILTTPWIPRCQLTYIIIFGRTQKLHTKKKLCEKLEKSWATKKVFWCNK